MCPFSDGPVQFPESWVKTLTEELEAEIVRERHPLELLKAEQERISREEKAARSEPGVTEQDLAVWQEVLTMAIRLAGNCHAAYLKARPSIRRRFNEAALET
jgi:hypothetical protein